MTLFFSIDHLSHFAPPNLSPYQVAFLKPIHIYLGAYCLTTFGDFISNKFNIPNTIYIIFVQPP
jgi:hypothetical protein